MNCDLCSPENLFSLSLYSAHQQKLFASKLPFTHHCYLNYIYKEQLHNSTLLRLLLIPLGSPLQMLHIVFLQ